MSFTDLGATQWDTLSIYSMKFVGIKDNSPHAFHEKIVRGRYIARANQSRRAIELQKFFSVGIPQKHNAIACQPFSKTLFLAKPSYADVRD